MERVNSALIFFFLNVLWLLQDGKRNKTSSKIKFRALEKKNQNAFICKTWKEVGTINKNVADEQVAEEHGLAGHSKMAVSSLLCSKGRWRHYWTYVADANAQGL